MSLSTFVIGTQRRMAQPVNAATLRLSYTAVYDGAR